MTMMIGGGLMIGMGLLIMLLVIGLPVLLVFTFLGGLQRNQNPPADTWQNPRPAVNNSGAQAGQPVVAPARYCAHCGAGMQSDWTHCPQCGSPING